MISTVLMRVKANLEAAGISFAAFAKLANIPESSLRTAMQGKLYFGAVKEARLLTLSVRVAELAEALKPLGISKGEVESLKVLLDSEKSPDEVRQYVAGLFE
jgi:hypothetical protein